MERNLAISRTGQIILLACAAYNLGRYGESFSGSGWDYAVLALNVLLLALVAYLLLRGFWKPNG